jgi:hypothetical protein
MQIMVIVALIALASSTFLNSLGLILMKQSILKLERERSDKKAYMQPRYTFGFALLVTAALILIGKFIFILN